MSGHFDDEERSRQPACEVRGLVAPGAMCSSVMVGGGCGRAAGTCDHQRAPGSATAPAPARIQIGPLDV